MKKGRLARKLKKLRKGPFPARPCVVCGTQFAPTKAIGKVCPRPECRAQHKRDTMNARNRGEMMPGDCRTFCVVCGIEFMGHFNARVCSRPCLLERQKRASRERLGTEPCSCIVCGAGFWPPNVGQHYTCSPACQRAALRRKNRRSYEVRRERCAAEHQRRYREDPAYRDRQREIDHACQRRRNALTAALAVAKLLTQLESK
jgi:hypothetical protein